jgi:shikimate kinase
LPSSRLLGGYWKVVNKTPDAVIVVLSDTPENILKRITFYDIDSRPLYKRLTDDEKLLYLREIEGENSYYKPSFRRAHVSVDIAGRGPDDAARQSDGRSRPSGGCRCVAWIDQAEPCIARLRLA